MCMNNKNLTIFEAPKPETPPKPKRPKRPRITKPKPTTGQTKLSGRSAKNPPSVIAG